MNKSKIKAIVIIAGVIAAFLLMRFLHIKYPIGRYLSGYTLSHLLIAVLALIFGPIVGGTVGLLTRFCSVIMYIIPNITKLNPQNIPLNISMILVTGLYGFVIGKLFENKSIKADSKDAVLNIGLFSLLVTGLFIVVHILNRLIDFIYLQLLLLFQVIDKLNFTLIYPKIIVPWLIQGLVIGCISFVVVFFFYKFIKLNIPYFPGENSTPETQSEPNNESQKSTLEGTVAESRFDGGLLSFIGWNILGFIVTVITFGICFPWALCMIYGWRINHTIINGRRLKFTGKAISLFGHWILWILLCIITLGIYSFWLFIALEKWKVKNTTFAD